MVGGRRTTGAHLPTPANRDRFDLEGARHAAGARTGSFNAHLPTIVAVPQTLIDEQEASDEPVEDDPFLGQPDSLSTPARKGAGASLYRVSSIYGSFNEHGSPHYLQLARPPGRNDSCVAARSPRRGGS